MSVTKTGQKAHDFILRDQHNIEFRLSAFRGRKVLLSFHPLAWTKVCARQMQSLEKNLKTFDLLNTMPVGMSVDAIPSKHAWARELKIRSLRMLADFWPHGKVAQAYGLFRKKEGFSERANVIVDEFGQVVWVKVYPIKELPDIKEIIKFLSN
ncbi:MAG: thioredoxin peroxidase [Candidatus Edwardsbacteria bacterium RIFOXYD12_FULL_50_11]|uniref:Thioredoxin peroxidase n=1 Tax=Candidatus Edwardsbacteria bacterium GWF2_54_11 TaxID=1817851 RepID=A0A1F5R4Q5_9BACT|nr:MAG: thioredoxin peroxidase [Candidatus Edwardsbacteria bacterium RifOxyC12_full_54_24]OGF07378.1 MAG: thioredoxin peroxidase [Candidatus Edwardsbacteria bacterium RifOxyA12_full_54_48]OGF09452.1 MAG: thioredoxin peroxidase [Candidatus Edwardsbacteria bacterium GWF2_54_11]OGF09630.1 MAG: thioredoxin peroxidase [Candidatus Edwardsbacteria bacterium GWE2_54_12]OGF18073.1 MAG: thioredoxin peroxidase [Candidatus Edwardsbacteria bacterium RIFOXYD12_FULL_50_11]OGJ19683.1 MAG: thioredoxin peroxida